MNVPELLQLAEVNPEAAVSLFTSLEEFKGSSEMEQVELCCFFIVALLMRYHDPALLGRLHGALEEVLLEGQRDMLRANLLERAHHLDVVAEEGDYNGRGVYDILTDF